MARINKFNNLHARVGHLWDTDKADGSEVIVAEIDPHGFMGNMETRQEVAELLASAPRLAEQNRILREALRLAVEDLESANEWSSQDNFRESINGGRAALEATKEGA